MLTSIRMLSRSVVPEAFVALGAFILIALTTSITANAGPITLANSNAVFCFSVGNGTAIHVTINTNCGQTGTTTVTGTASNTAPNASSGNNYSISQTLITPEFDLVNPQTVGNTTTFNVNQIDALTFRYFNSGSSTTFLQGPLTFTQVAQTTSSSGGNPVTTAIALLTVTSGTPAFMAEWGWGGTLTARFDFGGGEELLPLYNQTGITSGDNWSGVSGKRISGTLNPNPAGSQPNGVPEPSTLLFLGSGLVGLAIWRRRKAA